MQLLGSKWVRTTAYHPIANGLILHCQLKAALKAHPNPAHWTEILPMILLGIRTAVKEDIGCSTAELVYSTTLCLPGEIFDDSVVDTPIDLANYVETQCERSIPFPLVHSHDGVMSVGILLHVHVCQTRLSS